MTNRRSQRTNRLKSDASIRSRALDERALRGPMDFMAAIGGPKDQAEFERWLCGNPDATPFEVPVPTDLIAVVAKVGTGIDALLIKSMQLAFARVVFDALTKNAYQRYPELRPSLAESAIAAAGATGHPLASEPDRIREAAAEIGLTRPEATAVQVLIWAEARSRSLT